MAEGTAKTRIVGRYEVIRELGRGGMAIVYLARQQDLDRHVALKELSRFHAGSAEFAHRFLRESRLAGSLNHPNIVTVYEYFEDEGMPYIAMEYVPRGSLRSHTKRLSLAQIAGVLEGVLAGLTNGEQAGIVHRDLKPENIMVTGDGRVKITDFGIARATQSAGTRFITATGMTVGTPSYMAPEQAMAGDIGPWTDLYSVGVIAYELTVGHVPFHDTDAPMVILMRHVNEQIPSVRSLRPGVDQAMSDWIDELLIKDPKQRTQSAAEAWEQLEEIIVNQLGPLWRRGARLLEDQRAAESSRPLTPAPFESQGKLPTPAPTPVAPAPESTGGFVTVAGQGPLATPEPSPPAETPLVETPGKVGPDQVSEPGLAATADAPPSSDEADTPPVSESPPPTAADTTGEEATGEEAPGEDTPPAAPREPSGFVTFDPRAAVLGKGQAPPPATPTPPPTRPPEPPTAAPEPQIAAPEPAPAPEPVPTADETLAGAAAAGLAALSAASEAPAPAAHDEPNEAFASAAEPASDLTTDVQAVSQDVPAAASKASAHAFRAPDEESAGVEEAPTEPGPDQPDESSTRGAAAGRSSTPRARTRPPTGVLVAAAAGLVAAAAAVGFVLAPTSTNAVTRNVPLTQSATAGALTISYPAGWSKTGTAPAATNSLKLAKAVTLAADKSAPGGALVVGTGSTQSESLLPPDFLRVAGNLPQASYVKLGKDVFKRYLNVIPAGGGEPESIYVLPTSKGIATVACVDPRSGAPQFAATCERAVGTLTTTASVLPFGASPAYARALSSALSTLDGERTSLGAKLSSAKTPSAEASTAGRLAHAYSTAAVAASKVDPGPVGATAGLAIVAALKRLADAYTRLGRAASGHDGGAYGAARHEVSAGEAALTRALAQLRQAGYTVG